MTRTKVTTKVPGWRRLGILYAGGLLVIATNVLGKPWLSYHRATPGGGTVSVYIGLGISLLVVLPGLLAAMSFSEQRLGRAVLEAIALGLGVLTAISIWVAFSKATAASGNLSVAFVLMAMYVAIRLIALGIVRHFVVSIIFQDGTLCESCAYNLTGNASGVCPECGTPVPGPVRQTLGDHEKRQ